MKAVMVMYDSLNRRMLEPYGCSWVKTPNFCRLAKRSVTFDCNYVGSMPCMPARRELHTGRYNFLHRGWGPMEPFDDSMPELLNDHGIYTHLVSDHQHYWEDGGATYHNRYSSWEATRGQEGDRWKVLPSAIRTVNERRLDLHSRMYAHDEVNRRYRNTEERMAQACTFKKGLEFIENNHEADQWFLQIETFDPHEPFYTQNAYKKLYPDDYDGRATDWPPYYPVTYEDEKDIRHVRCAYAALISMCDHYLGKVLDIFDKYDLWKDTMLIVNTDHGYLLGEHGWWSKTVMPVYDEIARTPLFLYDPRNKIRGERRPQLTQTIDLPVTLLNYFNVPVPKDMQGKDLRRVVEHQEKIHDYVLYGYHETHINITDGRWVYMMAPDTKKPVYEYTLMPTHMRAMFSPEEMRDMELAGPFSFTKGCRVMKIRGTNGMNDAANFGSKLFDLASDPGQKHPLDDPEKEALMINEMRRLMAENDCPAERYERFGVPADHPITADEVRALDRAKQEAHAPKILQGHDWEDGAANMYLAVVKFAGNIPEEVLKERLLELCGDGRVTMADIDGLIDAVIPKKERDMVRYFAVMYSRTEEKVPGI